MNMSYGYDAVGNIKTLANAAAVPTSITKGGATSYSFGYDDLYQLTSATGAFAKPSQATQKFTLSMAYDGIHNITHKTQTAFLALSNGSTTPNVALTYDYPYAYAGGGRTRQARWATTPSCTTSTATRPAGTPPTATRTGA